MLRAGVNGQAGVARVCPAKAGSSLTLEFHTDPRLVEPGVLDKYHRGPCAVYLKKVTSAVPPEAAPAAGDGWFKIWYEGYDDATNRWCTEKLMSENGRLSVTIPTDIEGGYYLVRTELLALHQANLNPPNPQFFVGCAQIFLSSGGTSIPKDTVAIPGYVDLSKPAMTFNIWDKPMKLPYPEFGPSAHQSGTNGSQMVGSGEQTEGLKPAGCILESANWCGFEVASYSTQDGCWKVRLGPQLFKRNHLISSISHRTLAGPSPKYATAPPVPRENITVISGMQDAMRYKMHVLPVPTLDLPTQARSVRQRFGL